MKKVLALLMACTIIFTVLPLSVFAEEYSSVYEEMPVRPAGENDNLKWSVADDILKIETKNGMKEAMNEFYIYGGSNFPEYQNRLTDAPWRDYSETVKKIVIGEGVTLIGWFAFHNFDLLEEVYIPSTVREVQPGAFGDCPKLKTVYFAGSKDSTDGFYVQDNDGNKTFIDADWVFNSPYIDGYAINYVLNGGKNNTKNPVSRKPGESVTLLAPSKTGYTFGGWYTDSTFKTKVTTLSANKNYTVYAKWTANKYKIVFNKNGATSGTMSSVTYTYGKSYTLSENGFVKTNYTFTGWNTKADGSGKTYTNKATVKNLSSKSGASITLYAQWKRTTYTIAFDGNKATSGTMEPMKAKTALTYTLTSNAFKRSCYTFTGWNTKADGSGTTYANNAKVKDLKKTNGAKITLYAQWKLNKNCYVITYKLNGGTNNSKNPKAYSKSGSTITLAAPTKKGYTFEGWYSDSALTKKVTTIRSGSTGSKTFYAKWTANKYTVVFNKNGATSGTMASKSCTYGKTYTLTANTYKKSGYTFEGWNTKADGSGTAYKNKAEIKNLKYTDGAKLTLYAQWSKPVASGESGELKWMLSESGMLNISKGSGYTMGNYIVITTTTAFGSFSQSTAPWASRGTGTRELVKKAEIANGITNIGKFAFYYCQNMTQITIPATVTSIELGAFYRCTSLKDVYFGGTKEQWEKIYINTANDGNLPLTDAEIHFAK